MKGLLTPQPIRVSRIYYDGEASRHFTFEPVDASKPHTATPGQFFSLTLPGQGEAAFTYLSLPDAEGQFSALIRRVGALTSSLFTYDTGSLLGYRGPFGNSWPLEQLRGRRVLILAGGCGLAPLASIIKALIADTSIKVALIYGSQTPDSRVLNHERSAWHTQIPLVETFDLAADKGQNSGTPLDHVDIILPELGGEPEAILTCGPEVMMNAVGNHFLDRGLSPGQIWLALERRMHCGVGLCGHCYLGSSYVCTDGPIYKWDTLTRLRSQTSAM